MSDNSSIFQAAARVANRYKQNFEVKHLQLQQLWNDCPEADMDNTFQRIDLDDLGRFDHTFAKKAFNQITNGYKIALIIKDQLINDIADGLNLAP